MRKRIALLLSYEDQMNFNTKLSDVTFQDVLRFNKEQAHISGAYKDWDFMGIKIFLDHDEFDVVGEGCYCPRFTIREAKKRYPFLFEKTNPILYRKFCA